MSVREKREDTRGEDDVDEGDFEKVNPAEAHELVVAETRQRPAHPDEEKEQCCDLAEKDGDVHAAPNPRRHRVQKIESALIRAIGNERQMPAAQKHRHYER